MGFVSWPLPVAPSWSWKDCALLDPRATVAVAKLIISGVGGWQRCPTLAVAQKSCSCLWPERGCCRIYVSQAGLHRVVWKVLGVGMQGLEGP